MGQTEGRGAAAVAPPPPPPPEPPQPVWSIGFSANGDTTLYTPATADGGATCVSLMATVTVSGQPATGAAVGFAIQRVDAVSPAGGTDGQLDKSAAMTDASGSVAVEYCGDDSPGRFIVTGTVQGVTGNSPVLIVQDRETLSLRYVGYRKGNENVTEPTEPVFVNIQDSGLGQCAELEFVLEENTSPKAGATVSFRTGFDYPQGLKLATREVSGIREQDPVTGKMVAFYQGVTAANGKVRLPVCGGIAPGNTVVTGTVTDNTGREYSAGSPVISVVAGLPSATNFTLQYDATNAKTVTGYFNTDSAMVHPFTINVSANRFGDPVADFPVSVAAETGVVTVQNNGSIDPETNTAAFTFRALHMTESYAHRVTPYQDLAGLTRCDPLGLAVDGTSYRQLSRNWRSTLTFWTRGQEAYHDANGNGVYDGGGDGFWDKDKDGTYSPDKDGPLTFDANNDGFDPTGEWFIDQPSPFVDVDENGAFDPEIDIPLTDVYVGPNGKRDADATVWSYDIVPIFMGHSVYSMLHSHIPKNDGMDTTSPVQGASDYWADLVADGLLSPTALAYSYGADLSVVPGPFDMTPNIAPGKTTLFFFAQGVCGNPPPGGTSIEVTVQDVVPAAFGDRAVFATFYSQPGDLVRDHARHLLHSASGKNSAVIAPNIVEHPATEYSTPIRFDLNLGACNALCTGATAGTSFSCASATKEVALAFGDVVVYKNVSYAGTACSCGANAQQGNGPVCVCDAGYRLEGRSCVLDDSSE